MDVPHVWGHNSETKAQIKNPKTCGPSKRPPLTKGKPYSWVRNVSIEKPRDNRKTGYKNIILEIGYIKLYKWFDNRLSSDFLSYFASLSFFRNQRQKRMRLSHSPMTFDQKVFLKLLFHIPGTQALTLQSVQESFYVRHFVFERREKPKVHFSNSSLLFHNTRHHSQLNIVDVKSRIMTYPQINPIRRHQPFRR